MSTSGATSSAVSAFLDETRACPCCGQRQYRALQKQKDALTVSLCSHYQTIQVRPDSGRTVSFDGMAHRLRQVGQVRYTVFLLRFEVEDVVMTLFRDGRALIKGPRNHPGPAAYMRGTSGCERGADAAPRSSSDPLPDDHPNERQSGQPTNHVVPNAPGVHQSDALSMSPRPE